MVMPSKLWRFEWSKRGMLKSSELGEVSFGMLKLGELGEVSFGKYKLCELGK